MHSEGDKHQSKCPSIPDLLFFMVYCCLTLNSMKMDLDHFFETVGVNVQLSSIDVLAKWNQTSMNFKQR